MMKATVKFDKELKKWVVDVEPEEGKRQIIKKLKIDEKKAEKLYKKWRYAYVNRSIMKDTLRTTLRKSKTIEKSDGFKRPSFIKMAGEKKHEK